MYLLQCRQLPAEEGASSSDIPCFSAKANSEFEAGKHREAALSFVSFPPVLQTVDHLQ